MDKEKALLIARDRIENINKSIFYSETEKEIAEETVKFLKFVEKVLEEYEPNK